MENQANSIANTPEESPLSESVRLKLMDAAIKFSQNELEFIQKYCWLHHQAAAIKTGAFDWDQANQSFQNSQNSSKLGVQDWQEPHFPAPGFPAHTPMPGQDASDTDLAQQPETRPGDTHELDKQTSHIRSFHRLSQAP